VPQLIDPGPNVLPLHDLAPLLARTPEQTLVTAQIARSRRVIRAFLWSRLARGRERERVNENAPSGEVNTYRGNAIAVGILFIACSVARLSAPGPFASS
jgi:hypothetical protein